MSKQWQRADFWPTVEAASSPRRDDFARGVEEGRLAAEAEFADDRDVLLQMIGALPALEAPSVGLLASMMMTAVERLVTDIAGNAPIDAILLEERAVALAALIATESAAVLVANPEDVALFGGKHVVGDATLQRGTVQVRLGEALHEDGVKSALARLRDAIEQMGIAL